MGHFPPLRRPHTGGPVSAHCVKLANAQANTLQVKDAPGVSMTGFDVMPYLCLWMVANKHQAWQTYRNEQLFGNERNDHARIGWVAGLGVSAEESSLVCFRHLYITCLSDVNMRKSMRSSDIH